MSPRLPLLLALAAMIPCADAADQATWAFAPAKDAYTADALLDLRSLNEELAGAKGFVKRSSDGGSFVRGDGAPLRFWGTLVRIDQQDWNPEQIERHYRLLAKRGVNLVRLFGQLPVQKDGSPIAAVDEVQIERFQRHVAAAKRAGIYAMLAPYWSAGPAPASWGMPDANLHGLIFLSEPFRQAYVGWMRELLTRPNPHQGGVPLKDEPAVAVVQLHNEDSLLWYTTQSLHATHQATMRRLFGEFLAKRHGSVAQAIAAWDGVGMAEDAPDRSEAGLHIVWQFTQAHAGGTAKRLADQLEFMASHQRGIYAGLTERLRKDIGCRQLINAGNWQTVDGALVGDAERWTYAAADVTAVNRYVSGAHLGEHCGWRIDAGHTISDHSVLSHPESMPVGLRQPTGHPFVITENGWPFPNRCIAEGPFVTAAFGSLGGLDGAVWSMVSASEWQTEISLPWTRQQPNASLVKWMVDIPTCLGGFPAHALAFRRGDIATPTTAASHEARKPDDLWKRQPARVVEGRSFDPNVKDSQRIDPSAPVSRDVRAFLVGPVTVSFDGSARPDAGAALAKQLVGDRITSLGGEIETDTAQGTCRVQTPRFQGVCGRLKAGGGTFTLRDTEIRCGNEFAAVSVVSLDGEPLARSRSVLLQATTEAWPTGWRTEPLAAGDEAAKSGATSRVAATGSGPWQVAASEVSLAIANPTLKHATALDVNGYAAGDVAVARDKAGRASLTMPKDAMYVVLSAAPPKQPGAAPPSAR